MSLEFICVEWVWQSRPCACKAVFSCSKHQSQYKSMTDRRICSLKVPDGFCINIVREEIFIFRCSRWGQYVRLRLSFTAKYVTTGWQWLSLDTDQMGRFARWLFRCKVVATISTGGSKWSKHSCLGWDSLQSFGSHFQCQQYRWYQYTHTSWPAWSCMYIYI